jgi:hypothetical protein
MARSRIKDTLTQLEWGFLLFADLLSCKVDLT